MQTHPVSCYRLGVLLAGMPVVSETVVSGRLPMSRTCGWGPPAWRSLTWRTAGTCGRCSSAGLRPRRRQPLPSTMRSRARGTARRWDAPATALLLPCCVGAVACWGHAECRVDAGHAWWAWWARQGPALRSPDLRIPPTHSCRHRLSSAAARASPPRSGSGCGLQSLAPDVRGMGAALLLLLPSCYSPITPTRTECAGTTVVSQVVRIL